MSYRVIGLRAEPVRSSCVFVGAGPRSYRTVSLTVATTLDG
jgi:hypothetical protein